MSDSNVREAAIRGAKRAFIDIEDVCALAVGHTDVRSFDLALLAAKGVEESWHDYLGKGFAAETPLEAAERCLSMGGLWLSDTSLSGKSELGNRRNSNPSGLADSPAFTAPLADACQAVCATLRRGGDHVGADFMHEAARSARAEVARQFSMFLDAQDDAMYHITESGISEDRLFALALQSIAERGQRCDDDILDDVLVTLDTLRGTSEMHAVANRTATPHAFAAAERLAATLEGIEGFGKTSMGRVMEAYKAASDALPAWGKLSTAVRLSADGVIEAFETRSQAILAEVADFIRKESSKVRFPPDERPLPAKEQSLEEGGVCGLMKGLAAKAYRPERATKEAAGNVVSFKPRER
ncbi:MAG: hypothetical protein VR70_04055 [Rhodospirillaceae bacterium BRH_c57]|nr:MAG: hypothetical protein VR70_04055 [Rhodospirillaceae bacterium BRH_c57]